MQAHITNFSMLNAERQEGLIAKSCYHALSTGYMYLAIAYTFPYSRGCRDTYTVVYELHYCH